MAAQLRHSNPPESLHPTLEVSIVVLLIVLMLAQLLSYPPTDDPDPDGYVSYAQHLLATGSLPESRRLPGYPAFLAGVSLLSPRPIARNVYWVQLILTLAFAAGAWAFVRRTLGPLPAMLFLGILAAPCFFTRMSVVMLPDALYSMLFLPVLILCCWWVLTDRPPGGWIWLLPVGAGLFVLQTLRPTTFALALLLAPALILGLLVQQQQERTPPTLWPACGRLAAIVLAAVLVFVGTDQLFDTGARAYNSQVPMYRVVIALPPASNSPVEQRVEAAKQRFRAIEGQPIERARFLTYLTYQFYDELPIEDVRAVWVGRLFARPDRYLLSVLDDLRHGHYLLARAIVPFFVDMDRLPLFRVLYPTDDGSPPSVLFRWTGLIVMEREPYPASFPFQVEILYALAKLTAVWGLLALGIWQLGRQFPGLTVAVAVLAGLFVLMTAATNTVDARYLLPFTLPIYIAQAVGLGWIAQTLLPTAYERGAR